MTHEDEPRRGRKRPSIARPDKAPAAGQARARPLAGQAQAPIRQRGGRRPRLQVVDDLEEGTADRQFVMALARGLDVLGAFRRGEPRLGNQELAERTGLPKPTISRITHTLTQLGYLNYNQRLSQYELGGGTLSLGYTALANLDVRRVARPLMQELASRTNLNVGLGMRDRLMMLQIEAADGQALVGLRLAPGSRVPIATTAMGRAYLAGIGESERDGILDEIARRHGDEWPTLRRAVERAIRDIGERGYCHSIGEWHKDINAAGATVLLPDGGGAYGLYIGGPAYLAPRELIASEAGPMVAEVARQVSAALSGSPASHR